MLKKCALLLLYAAVIAVLSLRPSSNWQQWGSVAHLDKLQHMAAYCCFSLLAAYLIRSWRRRCLAAAGILLFSAGIEVVQGLVGRESSWLDLLANLCGIILGLLTYKLYLVCRYRTVKSIYSSG
ncbi:VanZ family protein [Vibrio navarrensis]|nr:VanZ family protein [Vibrio navarrensis]